ncbi:calcium ATPase [Babesia caballi]|uniref:Calcium ATPase n=1 Tax=Babesia caballi TaxID=5871 RepID=A0AAV4LYY3_BABCB|nr:calcium ATPase [Babesia caballi]
MYGSGTNGLKGVAHQVGNLFQNGSNWGSADSFLKQMGKAFTNRIGNIMPNNPTDLANKVGTYLNDIFAAVAVSGKADVTSQLTSLVTNDSGLYDAATLHAPINEVKKNLTPPQSKGFVTTVLQAGKSEFMRQLENKNKYVVL